MMKKSLEVTGLTLAMLLLIYRPVYAGVLEEKLPVTDERGRHVVHNMHPEQGESLCDCTEQAFAELGIQGISISLLKMCWFSDGKAVLNQQDFEYLDSIETMCEEWVAANIQSILPQGTPISAAPQMVAEWVANRMTYADEQLQSRASQTALCCYQNGRGVCTAYALAFNQILAAAPCNPETGTVDYTCEKPAYFITRPVTVDNHFWSAVLTPEGWKEYDVAWFDNHDGPRQYDCLGVEPDGFRDEIHQNPCRYR